MRLASGWELVRQGGVCQHDCGTTVGEEHGDALPWCLQVYRDVSATCLQRREHGHNELGRAREIDGDERLGRQVEALDMVREAIRASIQLRKGDRPTLADDGHSLRPVLCSSFELSDDAWMCPCDVGPVERLT